MKKSSEELDATIDRLFGDPDFIVSEKYENSLEKCLADNPDGLSNIAVQKLLMLNRNEHELFIKRAERIIRQHLEQ